MRSHEMFRSLFGLATAFTLLTLASTKHFPLTDLLSNSRWQCSPSLFMGALRILIWIFSEQGRTIVAASFAGTAVLSLLFSHPWPEARQLAIIISGVLVFLIFLVLRTEARVDTQKCVQPPASVASRF